MIKTTKPYTVSELTGYIKELLECHIGNVWLEGEISNYKQASSGHVYMDIKDKTALISAVMFRRTASLLKFQIENGQKVLLSGKLSVYDVRGTYQLIVEYMEPVGVGGLQLAFEQLKAQLEKEGLFDDRHKQPLPMFPGKVGVVTSPTGAAIRDILHVIERRNPVVSVLIAPVSVQGDEAPSQIIRGIEQLNVYSDIDVIIVGRGGGSAEDLWAFNDEKVARAIFQSKVPIISAVGHETDFTISDFVADLRAPTPSAAAEIAVPDYMEIKEKLYTYYRRVYNAHLKRHQMYISKLATFTSHYVFKEPLALIRRYSQQLDEQDIHLKHKMTSHVQGLRHRYQTLVYQVEALSPLKVMQRGYTVTSHADTNESVTSIHDIHDKETLKTRLSDGTIFSTVTERISHDNS